ncbi:hypothetical protein [Spirochaeta isovalerica]|uniref:Glucan phosphoethanolaminetransferase (Alkaline phosphatase superfamily) n=1 Tax=Spirochaeta isovalerica TaxID=150 RepID=A0A841R703_9SPIO|nr:hypothetical protein [Spirochaeta isovalerica]MBB6479616.1 glucan phosphoethanolaminetransferase (alkaline phosphatase superfamily) [Spirochaeta isovalerica]
MTGPILSGLLFSLSVILLSFFKPGSCRVFIGFFFIISGAVVNLTLIIIRPFFVYQYGMTARLELYRDFTERVIGVNPILFGVLLILFELTVGMMILGKKRWVTGGLLLASLFMVILIPLQAYRFAWALSVPSLLFLMRGNYGKSLIDMVRERREGAKTD